jgi:hypothetical protein
MIASIASKLQWRQLIVGNFGGHVIGKGALPDFAPWYEDGFTTGRGLKSSRKTAFAAYQLWHF